MVEAAQKLILESVKGFLASGDYSDLTVTCQEDIYRVHKVIVCSRAKFFEKAVNFGGQESESKKVDLSKDDPSMVKLLMQYLYEGDYDPKCLPFVPQVLETANSDQDSYDWVKQSPLSPHTCSHRNRNCNNRSVCDHHHCGGNCSYDCRKFICEVCNPPQAIPPIEGDAEQLSTHASMYAIGDQYDVLGMKELCKEKFRRACLNFWNHSEFAIAVHVVFSTTLEEDKGLRDIVSKTIADHMELVEKPEIEVLMTQFNGLAFGLLKQKVAEGWL